MAGSLENNSKKVYLQRDDLRRSESVECWGTRGQNEANTTWLQRMGEEEVSRTCKERELYRKAAWGWGEQSPFVKGYSQPNVTSEGGTSKLTSSPHSFPLF